MGKGRYTFYLLLLVSAITQLSCENDLRDVEKVLANQTMDPVEISTGVEIIYSDSAIVKAKIITPELRIYRTAKPYSEMKKGLTSIFYDKNQQETSRIIADYGIRRESENTIELRDNVVATTREGKIFKSDELIWDSQTHKFYSNKLVSIITPTQVIHGTKFWANQNFTYYEIQQSTGDFNMSKNDGL